MTHLFALTPQERDFLRALPWGVAGFALTLTLAWPLRFDEPIWAALATL